MKDMFEFAHAFTQAKRNLQEDTCMWPWTPLTKEWVQMSVGYFDTEIGTNRAILESPNGRHQQLVYSADGAFVQIIMMWLI